MPPLKPVRVYWDSDVFLAYFNKEAGPSQISKPFLLMSGRVKDITQARGLIRTAFLNGWRGFRANDAIHLGSAQWVTKHVEVVAFHTYNTQDFQKFQQIVSFPIQEPRPPQLRLLPC